MGWAAALFGRLTTMWNSNKSRSSDDSSSSSCPPPELTLGELNKATRSFSAAMLIGWGRNTDTAVYRASLPVVVGSNGKAAAAAKRLFHPRACRGASWSASDDELLRQQVLVLSRLRHDNVVRLLGYTIDATADVRVLLFEFADMGTLHDALHGPAATEASSSSSRPALSWAQRVGIALDVARGLQYLHDVAGVGHYGISSTNVLLFHGFRAKIADYDIFKQRPQDEVGNTRVATAEKNCYLPPEYLFSGHRSKGKLDVYSYGVLLLELLTGRKTWAATPSVPIILLEWAAPLVHEGRVEQFIDPRIGTRYPRTRALELARIALSCVQGNPRSRPTMYYVAQMIRCHIVSSKPTTAK